MRQHVVLALLLLAGCNRWGSHRLTAEEACERLTKEITSPALCERHDRGGLAADAAQRVDLVPDRNRPSSFRGAMVLSFDDEPSYRRTLEGLGRGSFLIARASERAGVLAVLPSSTPDDLVDAVRDALAKW